MTIIDKNHPMYGIKIEEPMSVGKIEVATLPEHRKNPLIIYHGNSADGFSAAWCFYQLAREINAEESAIYGSTEDLITFDFHAGKYSEPPPDVEDRIVYLVDFSYKRQVVIDMCEKAETVFLIDHHKTAIEDLAHLDVELDNFIAYTDLNRSGAMLAWDFLYNSIHSPQAVELRPNDSGYTMPPLLLDHIQDRDLWRFKLPHTREIQANVFSFEYTFENWDKLMAADEVELLKMTVAGDAIERKHHKDIKEMVEVCIRYLTIGDYLVPVASLPYIYSSDAGHLMAKEYEEGRLFAACYWDTSTHRVFSLRSCENGIDVSNIAKKYGGGGHKNAAGFSVTRGHLLASS